MEENNIHNDLKHNFTVDFKNEDYKNILNDINIIKNNCTTLLNCNEKNFNKTINILTTKIDKRKCKIKLYKRKCEEYDIKISDAEQN